jgi:Zn-dependent M28 family amino/carboxypeptidase
MISHDDIESCGLGLYGGPAYEMRSDPCDPCSVYRNRDISGTTPTLGNLEAQLYIQDQFADMGLEYYASGTYLQGAHSNVIGKLTGTTTPDEVYIIGGHFDHVAGDRPGGDDNASGTAGVLEAARAMSQCNFESTILFMCFNAEEDGFLGAEDYLDSLTPTQKNNIKGMTNLDMILRPGRDDVGAGTIIDVDLETRSDVSGSAASITWSEAFQLAATNYVPSVTVDATIWSYPDDYSDHAPFTRAGIPAVLVIENSGEQWPDGWPAPNNIYYHGPEDASDRLANDPGSPSGVTYDYSFATDIVKISVALTAQEAVLVEP